MKVSSGRVDYVAVSPDGRILITGEFNGPLTWWDLGNSTNAPLRLSGQRVLFTPDNRTLAVLQRGDSVQLWDVAARSPGTNPVIRLPSSFNVALSSDGGMLATKTERNSYENQIQLWNTKTGKLLGICTGHKQPASIVAFSPDGKTLASASMDSTLKLWNVATQQELLTIQRLGTSLVGLMFSPNGQMLVGSSSPFSASGGLWFHQAQPLAKTEPLPAMPID
jgi:WD40 repeat protein